jgi:hypothetical protein
LPPVRRQNLECAAALMIRGSGSAPGVDRGSKAKPIHTQSRPAIHIANRLLQQPMKEMDPIAKSKPVSLGVRWLATQWDSNRSPHVFPANREFYREIAGIRGSRRGNYEKSLRAAAVFAAIP